MNPQISIIIPIYKAEKYLNRCIESILKQSFQALELILVNDGSPDCSLEICKHWERKDNRVFVIDQQNQGAHAARLAGFKQSTAPYVTFVDADDYLQDEALSTLYNEIVKGYDVVKGQHRVNNSPEREEFGGAIFMEKMYLGDIEPFLWGGLYKRTLFDENAFKVSIANDIHIAEDWITNLYICRNIKKALVIKNLVYCYEDNPNSLMHTSIISSSLGERISQVVDEIIDKCHNERYQYLSQLKEAGGIANLFTPGRPFERGIYISFRSFVKQYGVDPLLPYVDKRYLFFSQYELIYRLYTWAYRTAKFFVKQRGRRKLNKKSF